MNELVSETFGTFTDTVVNALMPNAERLVARTSATRRVPEVYVDNGTLSLDNSWMVYAAGGGEDEPDEC